MDESFEIPVTYNGEEQFFQAQFQRYGYIHRFHVQVGNQEIIFEPDEERNYRALIEPTDITRNVNVELLKAIAEALSNLFK